MLWTIGTMFHYFPIVNHYLLIVKYGDLQKTLLLQLSTVHKGRNRVVLITTKRGRAGEAEVFLLMEGNGRKSSDQTFGYVLISGFGGYYNHFVASSFGGVKEDPYYSECFFCWG